VDQATVGGGRVPLDEILSPELGDELDWSAIGQLQ
jgi:hypothetical protein